MCTFLRSTKVRQTVRSNEGNRDRYGHKLKRFPVFVG